MALTLLVGGARSGKSAMAVRAAARQTRPVVLIATAEALDTEMAERIAAHRAERPGEWQVVEEPRALAGAVIASPPAALVIVDCLTLWVTNLFGSGDEAVIRQAGEAAAAAAQRSGPTLVITNEVGSGIVPADPSTRRWRDLLGRVNAVFADHAGSAWLVVAGRLVPLARGDVLADV